MFRPILFSCLITNNIIFQQGSEKVSGECWDWFCRLNTDMDFSEASLVCCDIKNRVQGGNARTVKYLCQWLELRKLPMKRWNHKLLASEPGVMFSSRKENQGRTLYRKMNLCFEFCFCIFLLLTRLAGLCNTIKWCCLLSWGRWALAHLTLSGRSCVPPSPKRLVRIYKINVHLVLAYWCSLTHLWKTKKWRKIKVLLQQHYGFRGHFCLCGPLPS